MIRTFALAAAIFAIATASQAADTAPRTTFDHPAVAVARLSQAAPVDANTFLVQPPASVTWTVQPDAKVLASAALVTAK